MPRPKLHDSELQRRLLDESQAMIHQYGLPSLTLRSLASACGTSTTAVYSLFGNKDSLIDAVAHAVFGELRERLETVPEDTPTIPAVREMLRLYRLWVLDNEHLYHAFFRTRDLSQSLMKDLSHGVGPIRDRVERGLAEGDIDVNYGTAKDIQFSMWVFFHGFMTIELRFRGLDTPHLTTAGQLGEARFLAHIDEMLAVMGDRRTPPV